MAMTTDCTIWVLPCNLCCTWHFFLVWTRRVSLKNFLNSTIFLRARPFAFSLGSSKDQGLGNWPQVHDNSISCAELQASSNPQHGRIDCRKSCHYAFDQQSDVLSIVQVFFYLVLHCGSLGGPSFYIHEMLFGMAMDDIGYTQVPSLPLLQRSIRPAWQTGNASRWEFIVIYMYHLNI